MFHYMLINRVGLHYGAIASQMCHHHGAVTSMRSRLLFSSAGAILVQFEGKNTQYIRLYCLYRLSTAIIIHQCNPWPVNIIEFLYWETPISIDPTASSSHVVETIGIKFLNGFNYRLILYDQLVQALGRSTKHQPSNPVCPGDMKLRLKKKRGGEDGWLAGCSKWDRAEEQSAGKIEAIMQPSHAGIKAFLICKFCLSCTFLRQTDLGDMQLPSHVGA